MLICNCGWKGSNLLPNWKHDTAHCPECKTVFQDIKADDARVMSAEDEENLIVEHTTLVLFCEALAGAIKRT